MTIVLMENEGKVRWMKFCGKVRDMIVRVKKIGNLSDLRHESDYSKNLSSF